MCALPTTESSCIASAIAPNLAVVRQGIDLLSRLGDERYVCRLPLVYHASIGGHVRHIIEHYQSFLASLETDTLNYENRARRPDIEHNPEYAGNLLAAISDRLRALGAELTNRPLAYCAETLPGKHSPSSVVRELEFLLSHTVHHYALVAVMCRLQGYEPEADFGIAPSTLRYQRTQVPCAR